MRKVLLMLSSSCLLFSPAAMTGGPALAADLGDWRSAPSMKDEPIVVPRYPFSWTGFYIGGHLGYGWGNSSTGPRSGAPFDGGGDGFTVQPSGWLGGVQGGYNWQIDKVVFGVEGDLGIIGAEDRQTSSTEFTKADYGGYGTLTARLGYAEERWLFYLKGGAAFANIENTAGAIAGGAVDATDLTKDDENSRRLGGWRRCRIRVPAELVDEDRISLYGLRQRRLRQYRRRHLPARKRYPYREGRPELSAADA